MSSNSDSILSVSLIPSGGQEFRLQTTWSEPGAWGILLVDIARHVAQAYSNEGYDFENALFQIKAGFDAEWLSPTDSVPAQQ